MCLLLAPRTRRQNFGAARPGDTLLNVLGLTDRATEDPWGMGAGTGQGFALPSSVARDSKGGDAADGPNRAAGMGREPPLAILQNLQYTGHLSQTAQNVEHLLLLVSLVSISESLAVPISLLCILFLTN